MGENIVILDCNSADVCEQPGGLDPMQVELLAALNAQALGVGGGSGGGSDSER